MALHLKDMKRTNSEKEGNEPTAISSHLDDFPYGLRIHLDEESISKLGMDKLPTPGTDGKIMARVSIESASVSKDANEGTQRNLTLQIKKLAFSESTEELHEEEAEGNGPPKPSAEEVLFTG